MDSKESLLNLISSKHNMYLIVGLGNYGLSYEKTPHNAGFWFIDYLKTTYQCNDFSLKKSFNAEVTKTQLYNHGILIAKPHTFMNNSGQAVYALMQYYKIPIQNLIICHDDIDITIGNFKIQKNRSDAGHNGIKSIVSHINTKDFTRIRIGIKPAHPFETTHYVLSQLSSEAIKEITHTFPIIKLEIEKYFI